MTYRVVIELSVPDTIVEAAKEATDEFDPAAWATSLLEETYVKLGGPARHPYSPRVVEGYAIPLEALAIAGKD